MAIFGIQHDTLIGFLFAHEFAGMVMKTTNTGAGSSSVSAQIHEWLCRGVKSQQSGQFDEAEVAYRHALGLDSQCTDARYLLGSLLGSLGRLDEAQVELSMAIEGDPALADAYIDLGNVHTLQGRFVLAIEYYEQAIRLRPDEPTGFCNLSNAMKSLGRTVEALAASERALELRPEYPDALNNRGYALQHLGRFDEAVFSLRRALELAPQYAQAHNNLANTLYEQGRAREGVESYRNALGVDGDYAEARSNLLFALHSLPDISPEEFYALHREWGLRHGEGPVGGVRHFSNTVEVGRRLRIGYVSGDFREHSVSYFFEPVLRSHDAEGFEVLCYSDVVGGDEVTARLRGYASGWREIVGMSDERVLELVLSDGIDILVDLSGHTANNRLGLFSRRGAPVQVTYLGYPDTTGVGEMDYRLSDAIADPVGEADAYYTEELLRLPGCFVCYGPRTGAVEVGELPSVSVGHVTFGSFNNASKLNGEVVKLWSRVLASVPGSRLMLKAKGFSDGGTRDYFAELFAREGIERERLEFIGWVEGTGGHLALYSRVDIGLDPYPYNGTTTTCEALWMGVPVLTLSGQVHASRVGESVLSAVDLQELVARTPDEYVAKAVALAGDLERMGDLRRGMRSRLESSSLLDADKFSRTLETTYRRIWENWCANAPGRNIGSL
jgi:protein O-GlcNAc transferase